MKTATTVTTVETKATLLPRSVHNIIGGLNELTEAFQITCTGIRKTTEGIDRVAGLMLKQQQQRLLEQLS